MAAAIAHGLIPGVSPAAGWDSPAVQKCCTWLKAWHCACSWLEATQAVLCGCTGMHVGEASSMRPVGHHACLLVPLLFQHSQLF